MVPRALLAMAVLLGIGGPLRADVHDARECVELGWSDGFETDRGWLQEPWRVERPDEQASSEFGTQGAVFTVKTPHRAMAWTRTINPLWVADFPFLEVEYEMAAPSPQGEHRVICLSDGSTGPVTPGATNPENPLASGSHLWLGSSAPGPHRLLLDLREQFRSDRIAEITLFVRSGRERTRLVVRKLAFWAGDPQQEKPNVPTAIASSPTLPWNESLPENGEAVWQPIPLGHGCPVPAEWLGKAFHTPMPWPNNRNVVADGILFRLGNEAEAAVGTNVAEMGSVDLAGQWRGCELALLLGTRVFGCDRPWFGGSGAPTRRSITSPHDLLVRLEYEDGTCRSHFPWSVERHTWFVAQEPQTYIVPLEAHRDLCRIAIVDQMSFGQVFLLAASVNASSEPLFPAATSTGRPRQSQVRARPKPVPTQWSREEGALIIENAWFRLVAEVQTGLRLRTLRIVPLDRTVVAAEEPVPLVEVLDGHNQPIPLALSDLRATRTSGMTAFDVVWSAEGPSAGRELLVRLEIEDDGRTILKPTLRNEAEAAWELSLTYPQLVGCRIAPTPGDACYLLGTRTTSLGREPIDVEVPYGGLFPLQLMDIFAEQAGGGLGLLVADRELQAKTFRFRQDAGKADLSVHFPDIRVRGQSQVALPSAELFAHLGDWHEAFDRYRRWAWDGTDARAGGSLAELFYCRRDYPLGGTGYLFDQRRKTYTPEMLIDESRRSFGGVDMIDISGWSYNEATGRVGDYRSPDLCGLDELRRAIDQAHQQGVKVGLYFEAYLIDRRCPLAREALPAWQLIDRQGKPKWWTGQMEFFACPGVSQWRKQLAAMIADVVCQTGADAIYLDQIGFAGPDKACWSPRHGHPVPSNPLQEERRLILAVRETLEQADANCAIYVEQLPCDGLRGLVDGGFNYGFAASEPGGHETQLPLGRFVFGHVPHIEMISSGIRPLPVSPEQIHRCFFHGLGVWLKGRGDSWYSPQFRETAKPIYEIYRFHGHVFRRGDCDPLVPTLQANLYANRFATEEKVILTLYNAGFSSVSGDLVRVALADGWQAYDLWEGGPADLRPEGSQVVLCGVVQPHSASAFLLASPSAPTP